MDSLKKKKQEVHPEAPTEQDIEDAVHSLMDDANVSEPTARAAVRNLAAIVERLILVEDGDAGAVQWIADVVLPED